MRIATADGTMKKAICRRPASSRRRSFSATPGLLAGRARHLGQLGGRDRDAEEADGQRVEALRVAERGDRARAEPARQPCVYERADLHDAAADEDGHEVLQHGPHVRVAEREREAHAPEQHQARSAVARRTAARSRRPSPTRRRPRRAPTRRGLRAGRGATGQPAHASARDERDVPDDGRGVGEEEAPVAVEHAEAPRREHEQPRAGEEDAHEPFGQLALLALEAERDGVDEERRGEHARPAPAPRRRARAA